MSEISNVTANTIQPRSSNSMVPDVTKRAQQKYDEAVEHNAQEDMKEFDDNYGDFNIDDLLAMQFDENDKIFNSDKPHKGIDYKAALDEAGDKGKKLIANMRSHMTKKTQAISEAEKKLAEREHQLNERESKLVAQEKTILESPYYSKLKEMAEEDVQFDALDDASSMKYLQKLNAQSRLEEIELRSKELETNTRKAKNELAFDKFVMEHPDFEDYKEEVYNIMTSEINDPNGRTASEIYSELKREKEFEHLRRENEELKNYRNIAKQYGLKVGGNRVNSGATTQTRPEGVSGKEWARMVYERNLNKAH